jgi:hypothetical protein
MPTFIAALWILTEDILFLLKSKRGTAMTHLVVIADFGQCSFYAG